MPRFPWEKDRTEPEWVPFKKKPTYRDLAASDPLMKEIENALRTDENWAAEQAPATQDREGRTGAGACAGLCTDPESTLIACNACEIALARLRELLEQKLERTYDFQYRKFPVPEVEVSDGSIITGWIGFTVFVNTNWEVALWGAKTELDPLYGGKMESQCVNVEKKTVHDHIQENTQDGCGIEAFLEKPKYTGVGTFLLSIGTMTMGTGTYYPSYKEYKKITVWGDCVFWGTVSIGEDDIRASHARVERLIVPDDSPAQMIAGLQRYGILIQSESEYNATQAQESRSVS